MSNQKTEEIKLQLPVIEGYERTGEYRIAEKGEYFYHPALELAVKACGETTHYYFILRKIAPIYNEMDGYRRRYIEINALEDALKLVDKYRANKLPAADAPIYKALKELLK